MTQSSIYKLIYMWLSNIRALSSWHRRLTGVGTQESSHTSKKGSPSRNLSSTAGWHDGLPTPFCQILSLLIRWLWSSYLVPSWDHPYSVTRNSNSLYLWLCCIQMWTMSNEHYRHTLLHKIIMREWSNITYPTWNFSEISEISSFSSSKRRIFLFGSRG